MTTTLSLQKPPLVREQNLIYTRRIKDINHEGFAADLQQVVVNCSTIEAVGDMVNLYNTRLRSNTHAPIVQKLVTRRETYPWYTPDVQQLKRSRRSAERKWLHTRNPDDFLECNGDYGKLFRVVRACVGKTSDNPLPEGGDKEVANQFAIFFNDKITKIRSDLNDHPLYQPRGGCSSTFSEFRPLADKEVRDLIMKSKTTSCDSDPIPTSLVKQHIDVLLPVVTRIINTSLMHGQFPAEWKHSVIRPLLKKPSLDKDTLGNYRPVSNLAFLSKLAERAALKSLSQYLDDYNLIPEYQSAYRPFHSTETSILKMTNDILNNMEKGDATLLVAVDLSAAFDTVDHGVLESVLTSNFGIHEKALEWVHSYLAGREYHVAINRSSSDAIDLPFSVPQGSVAGPILYTLYASTLSDLIPPAISISGYADDHSFYGRFKPGCLSDQANCVMNMQDLLFQVNTWMCANRPKMNNSKTEAIIFSSRYFAKTMNIDNINVCGSTIKLSPCVKQLGVMLDNTLSFKDHVNSKCKTANFSLFQIRKIRKYLSEDTAKVITYALVISHLDFSNSILYGLPECTVSKLQTIQNQAAKVVLANWDIPSYEALQMLHWLPIKFCIKFKLLCLVFKCLHNMAPAYLSKLLKVKHFPYHTRAQAKSEKGIILDPPFNRAKTFADRAFCVAGPTEWNLLPDSIRDCDKLDVFRRMLKTHFYLKAFPS